MGKQKTRRETVWRMLAWIFHYGTGEFVLNRRPNGGGVVVVRAIWTTSILFTLAVGVRESFAPNAEWLTFSFPNALAAIREHLAWFGAILTVVYAALYARFSSQWLYLANLYNQISEASVKLPEERRTSEQQEQLDTWWAGFIEDAQDLHLATKKNYALLILYRLQFEQVRKICREWTIDGPRRIDELECNLEKAIPEPDYDRVMGYFNQKN